MASNDFWKTLGTENADLERVYGFVLERGAPVSSRELAAFLIEARVHDEEKRAAEAAARRAPVYQPKETYTVDQHLVFTALDNREGVIQSIRPGENPRIGDFQVMRVLIEGENQPREFAMAYTLPHPLNEDLTPVIQVPAVEEAVAQYGDTVRENLLKQLRTNKEFVHLDDGWYLRGLLPEINAYYLNLVEAAIEQANDSVKTADLLKVLEIPDPRKTVVQFALNLALANDNRFEDVGPLNEPRWFLTRLEPLEARERPRILEATPARQIALPPELETIAAELFDEADLNGDANKPVQPQDEITLILTYPHRRAGTLPLTPPVRALLPPFKNPRLRFNFIDATTKEKIPAYAVKDGNYIAGLTNWFTVRKLSPGAYILLKRGADPLTLQLDYQPQRERGLWVRVARNQNGQLTFSQERRPVAHKYDEEMLILIGDPAGIDAAAQRASEYRSLAVLLEAIFPELAKLSGAGRVHAKTLYSAVNLIKRAGPRAVLNALHESNAFTSVGGGYFVLNEAHR
jgi:hypothetical protein